MKEFALKHPIITFLLADSAICGVVRIVQAVAAAIGGKNVEVVEEVEADLEGDPNESDHDIQ